MRRVKKLKYLVNAISINMLSSFPSRLDIQKLSDVYNFETMLTKIQSEIKEGILHSAIGHEQLANILNVPLNRTTVELKNDDTAIVAQYRGPRLEEGAKILPEGAAIEFYFVKVNKG